MELQTTLSPKVLPMVDRVLIQNDVLLDPLSFVPTLTLDRNLSICGSPPGVVLKGLEKFELLNVNTTLTVCNLTFDLSFETPSTVQRVQTLLFDVNPTAIVKYVDVVFKLEQRTYDTVSQELKRLTEERRPARRSNTVVVTNGSTRAAFLPLPLAEFVNVTIFPEEAPLGDFITRYRIDEPDEFGRLGEAGTRGFSAVELTVAGNFTLTDCLLREFSDGAPFTVRRPLTVRGDRKVGPSWLSFDGSLGNQAFMDVREQLRFLDVNVEHVPLQVDLFETEAFKKGCKTASCSGQTAESGFDVTSSTGIFEFDSNAPGCRVVMKNTIAVYGCEFIRRIFKIQLYQDRAIQNGTDFTKALNDFVELMELTPIDNVTAHFDRFMGGGLCFQNSTITCKFPTVRNFQATTCEGNAFDGDKRLDEIDEYAYVISEGDSPDDDDKNSIPVLPIVLSVALVFAITVILSLVLARKKLASVIQTKELAQTYVAEMVTHSDVDEWGKSTKAPPVSSDEGGKFTAAWEDKNRGLGQLQLDNLQEPGLTKASMIGAISSVAAGIEDNAVNIEEQIATGGYGVVYRGTWKGVPVAIKTVIFQDFSDETNKQRQRAIFEAAISSSVAHKNIVQTYAYSFKRLEASGMEDFKQPMMCPKVNIPAHAGIVDWKLYIVQEYCNAGSVRQVLDQKLLLEPDTGRASLQTVVQIAMDSARGMAHLHKHNIVHGDLSTKNILLKKDAEDAIGTPGTAKIADFGLSIKMDRMQSHVSNRRAGTPFYMAPELAQHGMLSKRADVFSFGVFMWELYHSKKCYQPNPVSGMQYHPLFPKFPIVCPMPYAMLCVACISPNPEDRPEFGFITRVFAALMDKIVDGQYNALEDVRQRNMKLTAGLGKITGTKILEMIANQVDITVEDFSAPGSSTQNDLDVVGSQRIRVISGGVGDPKFFSSASPREPVSGPSTPADSHVGGSSLLLPSSSTANDESCIHLNQAYVTPFNCVVTVDNDDAEVVSFNWEKYKIHPETRLSPSGPAKQAANTTGTPEAILERPPGVVSQTVSGSTRSSGVPGAKAASVSSPSRSVHTAKGEILSSDRMSGPDDPGTVDSPMSPGVDRLGVALEFQHKSRALQPASLGSPVTAHQVCDGSPPLQQQRSEPKTTKMSLNIQFATTEQLPRDCPEVQWDDGMQQESHSESPVAPQHGVPILFGRTELNEGLRMGDSEHNAESPVNGEWVAHKQHGEVRFGDGDGLPVCGDSCGGKRSPVDHAVAGAVLNTRFGNNVAGVSERREAVYATKSQTVDSWDGGREMPSWDVETQEDVARARMGFRH